MVWFNQPQGWHMRGDIVHRGEQAVFDTRNTPLPGRHNRGNLCAVLAALEALGLDAAALAPAVRDFRPLPNRLQRIGVANGLTYVNDSISTTPHASLAALECFAGQRIALLVGGHDRGLDWTDFMQHMAHDVPPVEIVTMGSNGPRIHAMLQPLADAGHFGLHAAGDLAEAMALARTALGEQGGVVLLSPGAPSFGAYRDYVARGRHSPRWLDSIRTASVRSRDWASPDPPDRGGSLSSGKGSAPSTRRGSTMALPGRIESPHVYLHHPVPARIVLAR